MDLVFVGMFSYGELDRPGMSPLSLSPCSKYYEKEALLADPVFGPILASLLGEPESLCWANGGGGAGAEGAPYKLAVPVSTVGPCALEYTKLKTADHYWTDPSADELVQRHRIRGPPNRQDFPAKRPALGVGVHLPNPCAHPGCPWACRKGQLASVLIADIGCSLEMPHGSGHPRRAISPH